MLRAPKMSSLNKTDRINWPLNYLRKDQDFWSFVIFSNEKRFCLTVWMEMHTIGLILV